MIFSLLNVLVKFSCISWILVLLFSKLIYLELLCQIELNRTNNQ